MLYPQKVYSSKNAGNQCQTGNQCAEALPNGNHYQQFGSKILPAEGLPAAERKAIILLTPVNGICFLQTAQFLDIHSAGLLFNSSSIDKQGGFEYSIG